VNLSRSRACARTGCIRWSRAVWKAIADPALLPEMESMGLGASGWAVEQHPVATIKARYQLLIDNLLDLGHISFIHSTSIPGGGAVVHLPCEISESERSLLVERIGKRIPSNPHYRFLFPSYGGAVNQRNFLHGITPESPTSVHYFVMTARNFRIEDGAIANANLKMGAMIQPEDIAVIESIETNVEQFASTRREYSVAADEGAVRARRRLADQIRTESGAAR
jgi:phenylpropionate dioxygenase-like ring-hydroxylating dioxygenase large terminal subunit